MPTAGALPLKREAFGVPLTAPRLGYISDVTGWKWYDRLWHRTAFEKTVQELTREAKRRALVATASLKVPDFAMKN